MEQRAVAEQAFPSTTWAQRKVKIRTAPAGQGGSTRAKRGFLRLGRWDRKRPLRLEVLYKGGAESWWLVKARGEHAVFPGHLALEDVMARVMSEA